MIYFLNSTRPQTTLSYHKHKYLKQWRVHNQGGKVPAWKCTSGSLRRFVKDRKRALIKIPNILHVKPWSACVTFLPRVYAGRGSMTQHSVCGLAIHEGRAKHGSYAKVIQKPHMVTWKDQPDRWAKPGTLLPHENWYHKVPFAISNEIPTLT